MCKPLGTLRNREARLGQKMSERACTVLEKKKKCMNKEKTAMSRHVPEWLPMENASIY